MVMSIGICECGCNEFNHEVGDASEQHKPDYENWQQHQCTKQCTSPCLVARCRDSFDGDGFWVWCSNCDIQCPTSWAAYSDEPQEDEEDGTDDLEHETSPEYSEVASKQFNRRWTPIDIGTQIRVDFSGEIFVITDAAILNEYQDLTRLSSLSARPNNPQVRAFFATGPDGVEVLVDLSEIADVK